MPRKLITISFALKTTIKAICVDLEKGNVLKFYGLLVAGLLEHLLVVQHALD